MSNFRAAIIDIIHAAQKGNQGEDRCFHREQEVLHLRRLWNKVQGEDLTACSLETRSQKNSCANRYIQVTERDKVFTIDWGLSLVLDLLKVKSFLLTPFLR